MATYGLPLEIGMLSDCSISTPGGSGRATDEREEAARLRRFERPSGDGGGECAWDWDETEKLRGDG